MRKEIESAINRLKKNRSPGINNISAEELQAAGQSGVDVMFLICRKIWDKEKFPQMWKQSITVQEKDKLCCDNYRGVSLLSHCGKVMTSVILQRIRRRTEEILSEAQAGFRAGSTIDQLFTLRRLAETYSEFSRYLYVYYVSTFRKHSTVCGELGYGELWDSLAMKIK